MSVEPYGLDVRPWPRRGYFGDYSDVLAHVVDVHRAMVNLPNGHAYERVLYLVVWPPVEDDAVWTWTLGSFGTGPDATEIWETWGGGMNATETLARRTCREAAENLWAHSDRPGALGWDGRPKAAA